MNPALHGLEVGAGFVGTGGFGRSRGRQGQIWFVQPDSRKVEIHLPDTEGATRTLSVEDTLTTDLLPGWSVPVAELFD